MRIFFALVVILFGFGVNGQTYINGTAPAQPGSTEYYEVVWEQSPHPMSNISWSVTGGTITSSSINPTMSVWCVVEWDTDPQTEGSLLVYEDLYGMQAYLQAMTGGSYEPQIVPGLQDVYYGNAPSAISIQFSLPPSTVSYQWEIWNYSTQTWNTLSGQISSTYQPQPIFSDARYRCIVNVDGTPYYLESISIIPFFQNGNIDLIPPIVNPPFGYVAYNTVPSVYSTNATGGYCYANQYAYTWEYSVEDGPWFTVGSNSSFPTNAPPIIGKTSVRRRVSCGGTELTSNVLVIFPTYTTQDYENRNYVRENLIIKKGIVSWYQADAQAIGDKLQKTVYLDGLGRQIQSVNKGISPSANNTWKDIVKHYEFDPAGRVTKDFIPYATATAPGKYKTDAATIQQQYILSFFNEPTSPAATTYTQFKYDESPLNRLVTTTAPGKGWENSGATTVEDFNKDIEKVHIWNLAYSPAALPATTAALVYNTGVLSKNVSTDENGKIVITYLDLSGNIILKKVQESATPTIEHSGWACTYYVYDDLNRLRYVISAKAVAYLDGNGWNLNQTIADELCYKYVYDSKGRTISKKQPGIGEEKMIYDKKGRIVLTQQATQDKLINTNLTNSQWSFTLYDDLNRTIASGLFDNNSSQVTLQGLVGSLGNSVISISASLATAGNVTLSVENPVASSATTYLAGTTNVIFNSVSYYDNYNYTGVRSFNNTYTFAYNTSDPNIEATVKSNRVTGMITGEKTRILDGDNNNANDKFLFSTVYFNEAGRILQSLDDNINMNNGTGVDYQVNQYDFAGKLMSSFTSHKQNTSSVVYTITSKNEYDKVGRLSRLSKSFNGNTYKQLADYAYDELGQLKTKHIAPGYPGAAGPQLETITYDYNIRGWLTGINKDYALGDNNYSQWDRYFGMYLGYDNRDNVFSSPQLNGNVTGVVWRSQGDNTPRKFDFEYDNMDRFTKANFNQKKKPSETTWSHSEVDFTTTIQYEDGNGNIKSMKHMGVIPGVNTPKVVDDLQYSYIPVITTVPTLNGNQLKQVVDAGDLQSNNGLLGDFKNTNSAQAYYYDVNGNLTKDLNKDITTNIVYNFLNKPQTVVITGKSTIDFIYDGSGEKLRKKVTYANGDIRTTTYIGDYVYEEFVTGSISQGDLLQFVLHEEGRLKIITPHTHTNAIDYDLYADNYGITNWPGSKHAVFEYFIKDHLGNTRMVLTEEIQKEYYLATMESGVSAQEAPLFGQVNANGTASTANELNLTRLPNSPPNTTVWPGNNTDVTKLTATSTSSVLGPNMVLRVMAGDIITANVKYYYINNNSTGSGNVLNVIGNAFVNSISGVQSSALGKNQIGSINTAVTTPTGSFVTNFLSHNNETGSSPKAYLNIAFFDEQFKFVDQDLANPGVGSWFARATSASNPNANLLLQQKVPKNGWVFIYLTNESNEIVYFDDLSITQAHGRVAEENHYYPFGLKIAGISSRAFNKKDNKYNYQGDFTEEEGETGWDEFDLRMYDPQIGRWTAADPYDLFASPYIGMSNNPINCIDPDGGFPGLAGAIIGSVTATVLTNMAINNYNSNHEHKIGFWGRLALDCVAAIAGAGVGYSLDVSLFPRGWETPSYGFDGGRFLQNFRAFYTALFQPGRAGELLSRMNGYVATVPDIWGGINFDLPKIFQWIDETGKCVVQMVSSETWASQLNKLPGERVMTRTVTPPTAKVDENRGLLRSIQDQLSTTVAGDPVSYLTITVEHDKNNKRKSNYTYYFKNVIITVTDINGNPATEVNGRYPRGSLINIVINQPQGGSTSWTIDGAGKLVYTPIDWTGEPISETKIIIRNYTCRTQRFKRLKILGVRTIKKKVN